MYVESNPSDFGFKVSLLDRGSMLVKDGIHGQLFSSEFWQTTVDRKVATAVCWIAAAHHCNLFWILNFNDFCSWYMCSVPYFQISFTKTLAKWTSCEKRVSWSADYGSFRPTPSGSAKRSDPSCGQRRRNGDSWSTQLFLTGLVGRDSCFLSFRKERSGQSICTFKVIKSLTGTISREWLLIWETNVLFMLFLGKGHHWSPFNSALTFCFASSSVSQPGRQGDTIVFRELIGEVSLLSGLHRPYYVLLHIGIIYQFFGLRNPTLKGQLSRSLFYLKLMDAFSTGP